MKRRLLEKTVLTFAALLAFAVTSVAQTAQLLSFGFYKADNAGLSQDYVATIPAVVAGTTSYEVEIGLPASVDLTELVARFTVNEGNTVTVDGVAQTSGVTKNDFTAPIDYLVRGSGTSNVRYTIMITELSESAKGWTEVSVLDPITQTGIEGVTGAYAGAVMKISPVDNQPYVAFGLRGADNKLTVAKFDGSTWVNVGPASFSPVISSSNFHMDIAPDGSPYVAFNDQEAANKGGMSVMKFNGASWENVGSAGFTNTTANYVGVAALEGAIITSHQQNGKTGDFERRTLVVSSNLGESWSSQALAPALVGIATIADNGKVAYVYSRNASAPTACHIYQFGADGQPKAIVENYLPEGAQNIYLNGAEMMVAADGTLYLLASDDASDGVYKMRLQIFKNGSFSSVGGDVLPIDFGAKGYVRQWYLKPALSPDGTPYIVYNKYDEDNNLYFIYYDKEKGWSVPAKIIDAPEKSAGDLNFAFDAKGDAYLTFTDKANKIHLLKYNASGEATEQPAITFEAGAAERSLTVGLNAAGKVKVDWGNGELVEQEAAGAYDGWDNGLEFTGTPSGTVKVYGEGISYFQSFTKYAADATTISDGITSVDLSGVAETITELDLHQNNLKSVDLSKLAKLTTLSIGVNDFATIDLSALTALAKLDISNGKNNGVLTALDLSKNTKLTNIVASGNQLTTLDLSSNPVAKTVTVLNNQLTSVIFGANTATKHTINVGGNKLTSLDLMQFADCSGTYLRARDNDLTEVKLPAKVSQFWADGNAFTLAQLYDLKSMAKTLTYATTFTKAEAQAPLAIAADGDKVDLSAQAKLGETATTFTWKAADGTVLVEGTDYTVADGVFTFLKSQTAIHCEMTNDELNAFTAEKPYKTTAIDVVATGIATIPAASAAGTDAPVYNLAGQRVSAPRKGMFIKAGKTVIFK